MSDVASATEVSTAIAGKADKTYVDEELGNKVDKVTGKGLSTNDYTTAEKLSYLELQLMLRLT